MSTVLSTALRRRVAAATALATGGIALAALPMTPAYAADSSTTVQVSVKTGGFKPGWGANNAGAVLSQDGRYAVMSASGPLVPGQPQIRWQIVRRDRQLGTTELISKSSSGAMANSPSYSPSVSADGNVIAFYSGASNLVPGDTNGQNDVFVHDVRTGKTIRASATSNGTQVPGDTYLGPPTVSPDGKWVTFSARPQGYAPGDGDGIQAYLRNLATGAMEMVSVGSSSALQFKGSHVGTQVGVSNNGDRIVFQSLVNNHAMQVLVRDRKAGSTFSVGGTQWSDMYPSISPNGRFVVYESGDDEQVLGEADTNKVRDIFVRDLQTNTTQRVSVASNGSEGNGASTRPAISDDGRYVSFLSKATNLVAGDTNGREDIFRHDRSTGQTIRVNVHDSNGAQAKDTSQSPSISGDGQHVSFASYTRLSSAEVVGYAQTYVRDLKGKYPALFARLGKTPKRAIRKQTYKVPTIDIRTGPALRITWTPASGKGKVVKQTAAVKNNAFTLRTPNKHGKYTLTVSYADHLLDTRTITVPKPSAKKLAKSVKKGKKLKVRTVGVKKGQKIKVVFTPKGKTKGKKLVRNARTNKKGVLKVTSPKNRGSYRVVVKAGSSNLRKGNLRVR